MKPKAYVETTVVSYLTSRPSRDPIVAGHQALTKEWWARSRESFELCTSQILVREAEAGDADAARDRLIAVRDLPLLDLNEDVRRLARELVRRGALPAKAGEDAFHIALATVHRVDYLVTWNCAHIANAQLRRAVEAVCKELGYELPIICTPEELMGV